MTPYLKKNLLLILAFTLGAVIFGVNFALSFAEPSANPPGNNVPAPLNVSSAGQSKSGGLILNTGGAANGLIVAGGNVGIGTAGPGAKLDVTNGSGQCCASQAPNISLSQASNANGQMSWLQFHNAGESEAYIRLAGGGTGVRAGQRRLEIGDSQGVLTGLTVTGNVGIGTTDPSEGGAVGSKFTIRQAEGITGIAVMNMAGAKRFALNPTANGWTIYDGFGDVWTPGISQKSGNVGIGTTNPGEKLDVRGKIRTGDGNGNWDIWGGGNLHFQDDGVDRVFFGGDGNVGIGTTNPTTKFDVVGGAIKASGGLIIETRTSDPVSPAAGQMWLRTDL